MNDPKTSTCVKRFARTGKRAGWCMFLGLFANLLVANICALWTPIHPAVQRGGMMRVSGTSVEFYDRFDVGVGHHLGCRFDPGPACWIQELSEDSTVTACDSVGFGASLEEYLVWRDGTNGPAPKNFALLMRVQSGWPFPSFESVSATVARGWPPLKVAPTWQGGFSAPQALLAAQAGGSLGMGYRRALPLRPIWSGLIANSTIFTGTIWAAGVIPLHRRISRRRIRSQCIHCGYNRLGLTTTTVCPECGQVS